MWGHEQSADAAAVFEGHTPLCRFCQSPLERSFVDLGTSPLCESFVSMERLEHMEPFFPLHVRLCDCCGLVQLPSYVEPEEIFTEYAYFSSFSSSWVEHARAYVDRIVERLELGQGALQSSWRATTATCCNTLSGRRPDPRD